MKKEILYSKEERAPDSAELTALADVRNYKEIIKRLSGVPAADIAEVFEELPEKYRALFFRVLNKNVAAEVFVLLGSRLQEKLINSFTDDELSAILDEIFIDDTVDLIEEMPATVVKRILRSSDSGARAEINRLLKFPKNSVGSIMTTEYVRLYPEMTVAEALAHIRLVAEDKETVYVSYITDRERRLIGVVSAKELLVSSEDAVIGDLTRTDAIYLETAEDKYEAAKKLMRYGHLALPVVDNEKRLVGIVTVDDAAEALSDEAEEDFAVMAAVTPTDEPYLKTGVFSIIKSRFPWLLLLILTATFSGAILTRFEAVLPAVLLIFVPMLMGAGGNSGSQASVTVIRAISLGELSPSDTPRVLLRELLVGLSIGAALGLFTYLKIIFIDGYLLGNADVGASVALTVAVALFFGIVISKLLGAVLPIIFYKIGLDPAVIASPVITTLVDLLSLVLYFAVARLFLPTA